MPKGAKVDIFEGQRFYDWTVVKESLSRKEKRFLICKCDCGVEKEVVLTILLQGISKSCVSCSAIKRRKKVEIGQKYGLWTVLENEVSMKNTIFALCKCECGYAKHVNVKNLVSGASTRCRKYAGKISNGHLKQSVEEGQVYENRTIIKELPKRGNNRVVLCQCICGEEVITALGHLKAGTSQKCYTCAGKQKFDPQIASAMGVYKTYLYSSRSRKLENEISFEHFIRLTSQNCSYCGAAPSTVYRANTKKSDIALENYDNRVPPYIYNGIDRIDSLKGYTLDNVTPCCVTCNRMKMATSLDNFLDKIIEIYNFRNLSQREKDSNND